MTLGLKCLDLIYYKNKKCAIDIIGPVQCYASHYFLSCARKELELELIVKFFQIVIKIIEI